MVYRIFVEKKPGLDNEARELLDSAGCENVEVTWGSDPVEPVEAIMQAAGLRG